MTKRDIEATTAAGFKDCRSMITVDGRYILRGRDMSEARRRAHAEWVRTGRLCAMCGGQVAAGEEQWDHIVPRSVLRNDHPANMQFVHSRCHARKHARHVRWRTQGA